MLSSSQQNYIYSPADLCTEKQTILLVFTDTSVAYRRATAYRILSHLVICHVALKYFSSVPYVS
jgi:hypothetical protein